MLNLFRKKDNAWIISAKNLKKQRTEECSFLTREEIKDKVLRADAQGDKCAEFYSRRITKQDKWTLRRRGYHVYVDKYANGKVNIKIYW